MTLNLSGLGAESFLPGDWSGMNGPANCAAAGGVWVPYRTPAESCTAPVGEPPSESTNPLPSLPATCGEDPCGVWDQVWVRDACLSYLRCANPHDPRVIAMDQGFFTGAGAAVGGAAGQASRGILSGLFQNADGTVNLMTVGLVGVVGLVLLSKR